MSAATDEQRAQWRSDMARINIVSTGSERERRYNLVIDELIAFGHAAALEDVLARIEGMAPYEAALAGQYAYEDVARMIREVQS